MSELDELLDENEWVRHPSNYGDPNTYMFYNGDVSPDQLIDARQEVARLRTFESIADDLAKRLLEYHDELNIVQETNCCGYSCEVVALIERLRAAKERINR